MYDHIALYYDLTHADLTADIPFILMLAQQAKGPVLELGCGSGRLLLPLAQAGHAVTGLDTSAAMLARARQRLALAPDAVQRRVTLVVGDMTRLMAGDPVADGRYPLILIPYNTFMHLDSGQAITALKGVQARLATQGILFIDLANPLAVANTPEDHLLTLENTLTDPDNGDIILHLAANQLDATAQTLYVTWVYDRSPAIGGPVHRTVARDTYYYRYPHQMELLLSEAGFSYLAFFGDYNKSPFHEESERLLILAARTPIP